MQYVWSSIHASSHIECVTLFCTTHWLHSPLWFWGLWKLTLLGDCPRSLRRKVHTCKIKSWLTWLLSSHVDDVVIFDMGDEKITLLGCQILLTQHLASNSMKHIELGRGWNRGQTCYSVVVWHANGAHCVHGIDNPVSSQYFTYSGPNYYLKLRKYNALFGSQHWISINYTCIIIPRFMGL